MHTTVEQVVGYNVPSGLDYWIEITRAAIADPARYVLTVEALSRQRYKSTGCLKGKLEITIVRMEHRSIAA